MYPSLFPLLSIAFESDNEKWSWWYDPFYPFHFYVCTQIVKSRCGSLPFTSLSAPNEKKKVMIESLHGSSHVLIGLLFCYHYYTTTLDSTLTLIVSDMKREELYELLFYYMHSLTSLFAKKRKSNWFFTSSFCWSDASIKSFFLVHFNDIKSGKRMLKKILIIPKKWKNSKN